MARTKLYPPSVDFGFPVLGSQPHGWRRTSFAEVVEIVERPVSLEPDRKYRLVTAKRSRGGIVLRSELMGREVLTKTQFETKAGDFLISRRQIIHGACGIVPRELDGAVVSNEYSSLRTRSELTMEFLRHYSHSPYFQRTCFHSSHGVDVEKMIFKINEWLTREVDVPPLPEQRKIAAILSSVDDAIEATQAVIDQLLVVKKAMMAELLTRGLPGRHTRFKQTEIGEVPEEWTVVPVQAMGRVVTGSTPPTADKTCWDGEVPFVTPGDLDAGRVVRRTSRTVTHRGLEMSRPLPPRAVLVTCIGATIGKVGMAGHECCTNQQINALICHEGVVPEFAYYSISAATARLVAASSQTAVPILNKGNFAALPMALPPSGEQQDIAVALATIDDRIEVERHVRARLINTKSALMSVLLTGEVRVTPDPETPRENWLDKVRGKSPGDETAEEIAAIIKKKS